MSDLKVLDKVLYTASASATGGREGRILSDDRALDAPLVMPKGLGGPGGAGTNPEQLFAAGYAACFGSALALVARQAKVETGPTKINARVSLGQSGGAFALAVELEAELPNVPREQGEALLRAAHEVCPYSNATRGNIEVKLQLA
jgi:osmotically inducible protein OsmC